MEICVSVEMVNHATVQEIVEALRVTVEGAIRQLEESATVPRVDDNFGIRNNMQVIESATLYRVS